MCALNTIIEIIVVHYSSTIIIVVHFFTLFNSILYRRYIQTVKISVIEKWRYVQLYVQLLLIKFIKFINLRVRNTDHQFVSFYIFECVKLK